MPKKKKGKDLELDEIDESLPGSIGSSRKASKKGSKYASSAADSDYTVSTQSTGLTKSSSKASSKVRARGTADSPASRSTSNTRTSAGYTGTEYTGEYSDEDDGYTEGGNTEYTGDEGKSYYTEEGENEEWTMEHLKVLYMVSKYAKQASTAEEKEGWIRETQLLVLLYEGVVAGALDYDYAPMSVMIGKRNVWMNISQEGKDDLNKMRERLALNGLKLQSSAFQSITAYQVSLTGLEAMDELDYDARKDIDMFLYAPPPYQTELLHPEWIADEGEFKLWTGEGGFSRPSTVTETEDVSYVSSPWLPQVRC
jgi:hypothetical protein